MKKIIFFIMAVTVMMQAKTYKYTNSLIYQNSPYLLEHAHNPVDWYAWTKEAFKKAKEENKMIFLSIGYSTCHWCHVMEKESFENLQVAKVLNKNYISIKVDREEMPSIDKHFQDVYYLMNKRGGGWPLTILLTPDGKPFFSATYIPREPKYGRSGLLQILNYFVKMKKDNYKKIVSTADDVEKYLKLSQNNRVNTPIKIKENLANGFIKGIEKHYDKDNHGIGIAPKFPHASSINTLLDIYRLSGDKIALKLADGMLNAMAKGGIYDQIEGGFFRYSTDEKWMIPHFEKMLYTNAELLEDYTKAYSITKNPLYKKIATGIIAFVDKRFEKEGVFFSASDADSYDAKKRENEEGEYFVYTYKEAKDALLKNGVKNYKEILDYFGITKEGNFKDSKNNPYINAFATIPKNLKEAKNILLKIRNTKKYPFIDHKILTSWNALYIKALFNATNINQSYLKKASFSLNQLIQKLYVNGILYHQILLGKEVKIKANFEDYSFLISALLTGYEKTFNKKYLNLADELIHKSIEKFYVDKTWYFSFEPFRVKATTEVNSYVSSLSVMIDNLLKLAVLKENLSYQNLAKITLESNSLYLSKYPANFPKEIADYLAYKRGYIIVKSKKEELLSLRKNLKLKMSYPFILYKETKDSTYLACKVNACFAYGKSEDSIIKKIENEIKR